MPQESWNNLIHQQQKTQKERARVWFCVCVCQGVGGKKCVWLAVLQQCSCHPICPPVTAVLFSWPEQHAQTEAGFFLNPFTSTNTHTHTWCLVMQRSHQPCHRLPDGIFEESSELWQWHSKCKSPSQKQSSAVCVWTVSVDFIVHWDFWV